MAKRDTAAAPSARRPCALLRGPAFPEGGTLIASPLAAAVESVSDGWVVTLDELRRYLARKFDADQTCPLTTVIFLRIAAEASEEEGAA